MGTSHTFMARTPARGIGMAAVLLCPFGVSPAQGAATSYNSQAAFEAAAGGAAALTVLHFDNATKTSGKAANDPTIVPSYSSLGVDFLPFANTAVFPTIARGQAFQISQPGRDGLLTNTASPNPASDLDGRAIRFSFNRPERAVGAFFNGPFLGGDGGFLRAFDASSNLLGQTPISAAGGFVGLRADDPIARVDIVNTFNEDITFGIFDLQFSPIPEPAMMGMVGVATLTLRRRR